MDKQQQFRQAMSRLGAAVTLLTTDGPAGRRGMTASAVCSITDSPPTLLVCVNQSNRSHNMFIENKAICVNVLSDDHRDLSNQFAKAGDDAQFNHDQWRLGTSGAPALKDALVSFDCRITDRNKIGTHSVFFCEVDDITICEDADNGLMWFARNFHKLQIPA